MYKSIQLYVANTSNGTTSSALSYTSTTKGKIVGVNWQVDTMAAAPTVSKAELSFTPSSQLSTNDAAGVISTFMAGVLTSLACTNFKDVGMAFDINVGDRLYLNIVNGSALTGGGNWKAVLTVQV